MSLILISGTLYTIGARNQGTLSPTVKVLYFHGNNRCMTCNNMEKYTRELLDEEYQKEMTSGKITFEVFNFDDPANQELVTQYGVESSTLLLVRISGGKERVYNITELGFSYAKNEPEKFKQEVQKKLDDKLR